MSDRRRATSLGMRSWWLASLGVLLGAPALASPSIGLEVGLGTDLPDGLSAPANCEPQPPTPAGIDDDQANEFRSAYECHRWGPRPAGRVGVPLGFRLSDRARLVITPGIDVAQQVGRIQWGARRMVDQATLEPSFELYDTPYQYTGHFAFTAMPRVQVAGEAVAPLSDDLSLTLGAGVGLGFVWALQSVGANGDKHEKTFEVYDLRTDSHCNQVRNYPGYTDPDDNPELDCRLDVLTTGLRPSAEVGVGLQTRGDRPISARLSYSLASVRGTPHDYDAAQGVQALGPRNPVWLTVGFLLVP